MEADEGFYLTVNAEAGSIDIARRLAVCGSSVTFPPAFAAAAELFSGQLVAVPLTDPLLIEACAHLVVRARRRLQMPECGLGAGG